MGVRFFEGLRYRDSEDDGELSTLDSEATFSIRLGEQLASSIRAGISQVLDGHLLHQLEQPPARALYRTLQAYRRQDDGTLLTELRVPLSQWRQATGLTTDRSDLVRRALEAAHDELRANNYLEHASIEGRGKTAVACYVFADVAAADPALVVMLRQAGVTVARAALLAGKHPDRVEEALRFLEHRRQTTNGAVRNPGGLVADFLENPSKYDLPSGFVTPEVQQRQRGLQAQQAAHVKTEAQFEQLTAAPPDVQWAAHWAAQRATLQLILKRQLNADQWAQLEALALKRDIQAAKLTRVLVAATSSLAQHVNQLKGRLNPLLPLIP
ncbi:hypothetical protein [Deinococcus sp. QL22]|uniref:hypothetical protein n=1 Tax=Deinococcus sp. QL22 TaxID=2939437 RepID=UPI0020179C84|nr:hypothetical protein [Deinococcus sp. QL22]UQN09584.1 hypothetical protein M1R55_25905 [Deinococcus sp. QL22]